MVKVISRQSVEINGARQGSQRKMSTNAIIKYNGFLQSSVGYHRICIKVTSSHWQPHLNSSR